MQWPSFKEWQTAKFPRTRAVWLRREFNAAALEIRRLTSELDEARAAAERERRGRLVALGYTGSKLDRKQQQADNRFPWEDA